MICLSSKPNMAPFINNESLSNVDASNGSTLELTSQTNMDTTDKFLYYSNDETRIKTLKMNGDPEAIKKEGIANMVSTDQRKTRISFELYPDTILEDLMELTEDLDEDLADLNLLGNADSAGKKITELNLLDELLNLYKPKPSGRQ